MRTRALLLPMPPLFIVPEKRRIRQDVPAERRGHGEEYPRTKQPLERTADESRYVGID